MTYLHTNTLTILKYVHTAFNMQNGTNACAYLYCTARIYTKT